MAFFARDLGFPEAPVLLPDGSFLFTEMTPDTGCVTWVSKDGASRRRVARTGRPNGLAPDADGFFWVAETLNKSLLKLSLDGEFEVVAKAGPGQPFRFLNDLAFAPNGDLYLTDSGVDMEDLAPGGALNPDWENLNYDGRVYRVDTGSGRVETIDQGIRFTNGIAFGQDGNLYVAVFGQSGITVLGKNGEVVRRIKTEGSMPTNLVFGAAGEQSIYVTEVETGSVQKLHAGTDGFPLYI